MKKYLFIIITISVLLLLASCGDKEPTNNNSSSINKSVSKSESKPNDNNLLLTYEVPGRKIVMSAPNYQEINKGYTEMFNVNSKKFITITTEMDKVANNLNEVNSMTFDIFKNNTKNYCNGKPAQSLVINKSENKNINGIDVIRFEGTLKCEAYGESRDSFAVGYFFIMDNTACQLLGTVVTNEQAKNDVDEITRYVDAMIQTL